MEGLVPSPWGQFSGLWQVMTKLQSGHRVILADFSTWGYVSVSIGQLPGCDSECYLQPLRRNYRSSTMLNDYIIIIIIIIIIIRSPLTISLCFCIFLLLWWKFFFGWSFPQDFPAGSEGKASSCNAGDPGSTPGSGRSPGEGKGSPLQCSCLENSMDRGAWWAIIHKIAKCQTWLTDWLTLPKAKGRLRTWGAGGGWWQGPRGPSPLQHEETLRCYKRERKAKYSWNLNFFFLRERRFRLLLLF